MMRCLSLPVSSQDGKLANPDGAVVELNLRPVRRYVCAFVPLVHPDAGRPLNVANRRIASLVDQVHPPTGLPNIGSSAFEAATTVHYASKDAVHVDGGRIGKRRCRNY